LLIVVANYNVLNETVANRVVDRIRMTDKMWFCIPVVLYIGSRTIWKLKLLFLHFHWLWFKIIGNNWFNWLQ